MSKEALQEEIICNWRVPDNFELNFISFILLKECFFITLRESCQNVLRFAWFGEWAYMLIKCNYQYILTWSSNACEAYKSQWYVLKRKWKWLWPVWWGREPWVRSEAGGVNNNERHLHHPSVSSPLHSSQWSRGVLSFKLQKHIKK